MSEAFPCSIPAGFSLDYQTLRFFADAMPQPAWIAGIHGHLYLASGLSFPVCDRVTGGKEVHWHRSRQTRLPETSSLEKD